MFCNLNCIKYTLILSTFFILYLTRKICGDTTNFGELPFCGPQGEDKRLVFVSTLDGKLSALNVENGNSLWSISTGPGQMLSSSIHTLELTNNGQWVRMIPSLSGGLYKFDGDNIEPIPISAEKLLQSSFRYSDDIVISGGKESRTYGVNAKTGEILYECSMSRCDNLTHPEDIVGDVIVVQRQTQTVRAVEPRSGVERWNFSVGQHDVKIAADPSADCHNIAERVTDISLKVIVPDGLICAISKSKPSKILWKHKFQFPVVSAWQVNKGELKWVDLFGGAPRPIDASVPDSPLLYIGMHNKQLYIQESVVLQQKVMEIFSLPSLPDKPSIPSIAWKPVPASKLLGISGFNEPILQITDESQAVKTTAISVLYASEYVNGNGFFIYGAEGKDKSTVCKPNDDKEVNISITTYQDEEEDNFLDFEDEELEDSARVEYVIQFFPLSVWHWWKEILAISISTAVLVNVINRRLSLWFNHVQERRSSLGGGEPCLPDPPTDDVQKEPTPEFTSRYLTDFEALNCLGKGGFGIVFTARNKIDDCHYAIKRIPLPNREESRERVMREVKALAKLDHQNIVRFFNAWLECPPPCWQESQDAVWADKFEKDPFSDGAITVDLTGHVTPTSESKSFPVNAKKNILSSIWSKVSSFSPSFRAQEKPFASFSKASNTSFRTNSNSDSFIVFENSKKDSTMSHESSATRPTSLKLKNSCSFTQTNEETRSSSARMFLYIQMQLCRRDSLREWLQSPSRDIREALIIFDQIVQAVEYVHLQGLIHRDLKPSNIFFSPEGQVKVGDFGLVTAMVEGCCDEFYSPLARKHTVNEKHTAMVGTQLYMSPEQLVGKSYSYKVDIYSLGLILFELLVPVRTQMERSDLLTKVRSLSFPDNFIEQYKDEHKLLVLMLSKNPDKRPTTIGIRSRPPLREFQPDSTLSDEWHFQLPIRQRDSSFSKSSQES